MYLGSPTNRVLTNILILQLMAFKNVKTGILEIVSKYGKLNVTKDGNSHKNFLNSMLGRQKLHKHRIQAILVKISSLCYIQFSKQPPVPQFSHF